MHLTRLIIAGIAAFLAVSASPCLTGETNKAAQCETRDVGVLRGPKDRREIALAFTAHEFSEGGTTILDALASHRAKASFFFTGDFLAKPQAAALVRRVVKDGHYLGPHSDRHLLYFAWDGGKRTLVNRETFRQDLEANLKKIERFGISRREVRYFVPPYEHYNSEIVRWAKEMRLTLVNPTPGLLAPADYTAEGDENFVSSQRILDCIYAKQRTDPNGLNGVVLLMHLGAGDKRKDKLYLRLSELLDELSRKGYRFVRIDELLLGQTVPVPGATSAEPAVDQDMKLSRKQASSFARLAIKAIQREYPNKPEHVLNSAADIQTPRALHPAFYGSFDWHSSIHGHWMLVRLLRLFPDLPEGREIRQVLAKHLTAKNLRTEADYFAQPNHQTFERTYGWAWLLKLAEELHGWDDPEGRQWSGNLRPLSDTIVALYVAFLPKQTYPIRTGVHPNTAFGLAFALDYARAVGHKPLRELVEERSRSYFAHDVQIPAAWEPGGADFISPSLMEADLMRRVLSPAEFRAWLGRFLPGLSRGEPKSLFVPAQVTDRRDLQLVHLDGLNLSRAWCMRSIAAALPDDDPARKVLADAAARHAEAGLRHVASGEYSGEHWLATFAVYLLSLPSTPGKSAETKPNQNFFKPDAPGMPTYILPDILTAADGRKITTADQWRRIRRPEIVELFRKHVYGRVPATPYEKRFKVVKEDAGAMGGAATLKQVEIVITAAGKSLTIHLTLFVPNKAPKPVPTFLLICNRSRDDIDPTRQRKSDFWPAEAVIARGYAVAAFYNGDVAPDRKDAFREGIHGLLDRGLRDRGRPPDAWGTLAAWAWGASRCLDYFETDNDVAHDKVVVIGHSRGGKTALWAGAEDERFAMVCSNDSGCGGAALSRRKNSQKETVAKINHAFPHWFDENFKLYNDREDKLPVDQHMLIALIAPRAVCVASAEDDLWADPRGEFLSVVHAGPAYRLFGKQGLGDSSEMPAIGTPLHGDGAHYHIREGKHDLTLFDWTCYMDFADRVFGRFK